MIEYIRGELTDLTPTLATVEANGVGYGLGISLNTYTTIQNKKEVKLYVIESIREDAYELYGFATKQERMLFAMLISVSGVGANTARMILSSLSPAELVNVVSTGNDKLLKSVKGIGLKTAQRIIIDLRDKIISAGIAPEMPVDADTAAIDNNVMEEAISALTMLGFAPAPSKKVVVAILKEKPATPVETVIKMALTQIK
jgi:Holliday junction DNA helicase RuvA